MTELTVWIRAGGPAVQAQISSFVQEVQGSLPQNISSQILICTNKDDPILNELSWFQTCENIKIVYSQLNSFSSSLTTLAKETHPDSNVLSVSVGVKIRPDQVKTGLECLTGKVKVYGWSVNDHGNDGSCPGKGWYNTAALIDKTIVHQMSEGVPEWVDNGALGKIGTHTIGGNEEVPIMVEALRRDSETTFILNTSDPVVSNLQLGTGITFQEKLERKVVVSEYYMQKLHQESNAKSDFESWKKTIWSSLKIL